MSQTQASMDRLVEVIALLREHCPWMAALTHESLVKYLVEESYELVEAIEGGQNSEIRAELGDVLLQVVLHSRLAEEEGRFALADVAQGIAEKMVRRNPHVFRPDGSLQETFPATVQEIEQTWHRVKGQENYQDRDSPYAGIPRALPALALAQKSLDRADHAGAVLPPLPDGPAPRSEEELGEALFAAVVAARAAGLEAERALRAAVARFQAVGHVPPSAGTGTGG
jgi:uncharacterized protein YabN with tetrapyrrole methylase and pyrophosphatase domain